MAITGSINLSPSSRYKDTALFTDEDGNLMFGLFVLPVEFADTDTYATNGDVISEAEVPFLDIVALRNMGLDAGLAWWAVAAVNGILDADRDIDAGPINAPTQDTFQRFSGRAGTA